MQIDDIDSYESLVEFDKQDDRDQTDEEDALEILIEKMLGGSPEEVGFEETKDFFIGLQRQGGLGYTREGTVVLAHIEFEHGVERVADDLGYVDEADGDVEAAIERVDELAREIARQMKFDRQAVDTVYGDE